MIGGSSYNLFGGNPAAKTTMEKSKKKNNRTEIAVRVRESGLVINNHNTE